MIRDAQYAAYPFIPVSRQWYNLCTHPPLLKTYKFGKWGSLEEAIAA